MSYVIFDERADSARQATLTVPATHLTRDIMAAIGVSSMGAIQGREWKRLIRSWELSAQQARIVELILQGMADKEIAREMGLRKPTVRTYVSRIFQRTGCTNRMELALKVFQCAHEFREKNGGQQAC